MVNSQSLSKKADKLIDQTFEMNSVSARSIEPTALQKEMNVKEVWEISSSDKLEGYLFELELNGKLHSFSSLVVLDPKGAVLQVSITNYPASHGIQVTNRRWLNKLRIDSESKLEYGKNVDALSGATISAQNLINGIENLRNSLKN